MSIFSRIAKVFATEEKPLPVEKIFNEITYANINGLLFGTGKVPITVYNPSKLVTRKGLEIFDEIRRDEQVKIALNFRKHAILSTGWSVESPDGMDPEWEVTKFVNEELSKMKGTFTRRLYRMLSAMDYGFSITEMVFHKREDGLVGLKDLKTRRPHDFMFELDPHGNLEYVVQNNVRLPPNKFIVHTYDEDFDNPYGHSVLEAAYRAWWVKDNAHKFLAVMLEKLGIPPIFLSYNADVFTKDADKLKLQQILKDMQAGTVGVIPRGKESTDIEFWSPEIAGQASSVFIPSIELMDREIAKAILLPSLVGGTSDDSVGSFARSQTHWDSFMLMTESQRNELAESIAQERIIKMLVDINFNTNGIYPVFKFMPRETKDIQALMTTWAALAAKAIVSKGPEDEAFIRELLEFPEAQGEEAEEDGDGGGDKNNDPEGDSKSDPEDDEDKKGDEDEGKKPDVKENAYNPDQPRDENGRFGEGGGGGRGGSMKGAVPESQNKELGNGFFGTMGDRAEEAWPLAVRAVSDATNQPPEAARSFLDSGYGRHFGDEVQGRIEGGGSVRAAVSETTRSWMARKTRRDDRQRGAPFGPLLAGLVVSTSSAAEVKENTVKLFRQKTKFERQINFAQIKGDLTELEEQAVAELKSAYRKMYDGLVAQIRSGYESRGAGLVDDIKLRGEKEINAAILSMMRAAYDRGGSQVISDLPKTFASKKRPISGFAPKQAVEYLKKKSITSATTANEKLLSKVKQNLLNAARGQKTTGEVMDDIKVVMAGYLDEMGSGYVETVVRTNLLDSYNQGRITAMRDPDVADYIAGVAYSAIMDERTSPVCEHLDTLVFKPNDPDLDRLTPPNHFNCRSVLVPVMIDEMPEEFITPVEKATALELAGDFA